MMSLWLSMIAVVGDSSSRGGMIWIAYIITLYAVHGNLTSMSYQGQILLAMQFMGTTAIFQEDNAKAHSVRLVDDFLQQYLVNQMVCSTYSPNPNPLDQLWVILASRFKTNQQLTSTICTGFFSKLDLVFVYVNGEHKRSILLCRSVMWKYFGKRDWVQFKPKNGMLKWL